MRKDENKTKSNFSTNGIAFLIVCLLSFATAFAFVGSNHKVSENGAGVAFADAITFDSFFSGFDSVANDSAHNWIVANYQGEDCLKSNICGLASTTTTITATVATTSTGLIKFDWASSSEGTWDLAKFYINDELKASRNGKDKCAFETVSFVLEANKNYTFKWTYSKDGSGDNYDDSAYIKNVSFAQGGQTISVATSNADLGSVVATCGGNAFTSGEFAINDEITLAATPKNDNVHFEYFVDNSGIILSRDANFTFNVYKTMGITAVFKEYVQTPTIGIAYDNVSDEIVDGKVINHNYFNNENRIYSLSLSAMEEGATAKVRFNGELRDFDSEGKIVLDKIQNMQNTYVVEVYKEGKATRYISFNINVENVALEDMIGDVKIGDNADYPTTITLKEGYLSYAITSTGKKSVKNAYVSTVTVDKPTTLHFDWRVDSKIGSNDLKFYINGEEKKSIYSGTDGYVMWHNSSTCDFVLTAGTHTLKWQCETSSDGESSVFYVANLKLQEEVVLELSSSDDSLGTVNTEVNGTYTPGTKVKLIATPTEDAKFIQWNNQYHQSVAFDTEYECELVGDTKWYALFKAYADRPLINVSYGETSLVIDKNSTVINHNYANDKDRVYNVTWAEADSTVVAVSLNGVALSGNSYELKNLNNSSNLFSFVVSQEGRETRTVTVEIKMEGFTYGSVLGENVTVDTGNTGYTFGTGLVNGEKVIRSENAGVKSSKSVLDIKFSGLGILKFDYFVSSEADCDLLTILLDGEELVVASGENTKFTSFYRAFGQSGEHTLTIVYTKDSAVNGGLDYAIIKNFAFLSGSATGEVVADETKGSVSGVKDSYTIGETVNFVASAKAGYEFVCFELDGSKCYGESNLAFIVEGDFTLNAIFASVDYTNSAENPINVSNIVNALVEKNIVGSKVLINDEKVVSYYIGAVEGITVKANGLALTAENGVYSYELTNSSVVTFEFVSGDKVVYTLEFRNAGIYGTSITKGYGTEERPFEIASEAQFNDIKNALGAYFVLTSDITFTNNITPIGSSDAPFTGVLNGGGFKLINTYKNNINADCSNVGLFGYANGAKIYNLILQSPSIKTTANITVSNVGFVAGYAVNCEIKQITINNGSFTTSSTLNITNGGAIAGYAEGCEISNIVINGVSIKGEALNQIGGVVGYAKNVKMKEITAKNVEINGNTNLGGLVGKAESVTINVANVNVTMQVNANNSKLGAGGCIGNADGSTNVYFCEVYGQVKVNESYVANEVCVGGFAGNGGNWFDSVTYAYVEGMRMVGGFVGGYQSNANFTRCHMAGEVKFASGHTQNYLYAGIANGYGAWSSYEMVESGQRISVDFVSSKAVAEIKVFNASLSPYGIDVAIPAMGENGKCGFTVDANFKDTYASMGLLSETAPNGVVSNYGGMMIRFKMSDGTYKYVATLDRANSLFRSNFDINLDNYTSYQDNFASMRATDENANFVVQSYDNKNVAIWLTVYVDNANDFEHLSYIINGGVPATIGGYYVNMRSSATINIVLSADIDLTSERVVSIGGENVYLNRVGGLSGGAMLNQFYGLGNAEMMPFRGSFNGQNHKIKVNMNMPDAYSVGIINVSNEQSYEVCIKDLIVEGTIVGREQVGVLGFFEGYRSSGTLRISNVKNYAKIGGYKFVGGIVGNLHNVEATIENCQNYGEVSGFKYRNRNSSYIAGVIGSNNASNTQFTSAITINGSNVNYGKVTGDSEVATFISGFDASTITVSSGAMYGTGYIVNVGESGKAVSVNGAVYTSDENGDIKLAFSGVNAFSAIPAISYVDPVTSATFNINKNADLKSSVKLVSKVEIDDANNVYDYLDSNSNWVLNAIVTFNDGSTKVIALSHNLTSEQLAGNELVFTNVTLSNAEYNVSYTKTLKRMTALYENYVNAYNAMINGGNGTNESYKELGENAYNLYNQINGGLNSLSTYGKERAVQYLTNQITNVVGLDSWTSAGDWFSKIVSSIDESSLNGVFVDYGKTSVQKDVVLTFVDGSTMTKTLNFAITKGSTLVANAVAEGFEIKVGETVVYSYEKAIEITYNKKDITNIVIGDERTFTFDGNAKSVSVVSFSVLSGDEVALNLSYNGKESAVNAGSYEIKVGSLSGKDAIFYNVPTLVLGELVINKLAVNFDIVGGLEFVYNGQNQKLEFTVSTVSDYVISESEYDVKYSSTSYDSNVAPKNAGEYVISLVLSDNFKINSSSSLSYNFSIAQKTIENFDLAQSSFIYDATEKELNFIFGEDCGVVAGDEIVVTDYAIYNENNATVNAIGFGNYTVKILQINNENYKLSDNLIKSFNIEKANIIIKVGNGSSVYGDKIDFSQVETSVVSGQIYNNDNLQLSVVKADGNVVGDYDLTINYNNANYNVAIEKGTYSITKRNVVVNFADLDLVYNGVDQSAKVLSVDLENVVDNDNDLFIFEILSGENAVIAQNAGFYKVALVQNEYITQNYNFTTDTYKDFEIAKANLSIAMQNATLNFKQQMDTSALSYVVNGNYESIENIISITPYVIIDNNKFSGELANQNAGQYEINADFADAGSNILSNYDVKVVKAVLTIEEKQTYIKAQNMNVVYNGNAVQFVAEMFTSENEKLKDAEIDYVIKLNGEIVSEIKGAGNYVVEVSGNAGENYEIATATFTVVVEKNAVSVEFGNLDVTYNKQNQMPTISVSAEQGLDVNGLYNVVVKLNGNAVESAVNAGNYVVVVELVDSENFKFANSNTAQFVIAKQKLNILIESKTIVYGDEFDLNSINTTILSGTLYDGDDLNIVLLKDDGLDANEYEIGATYSNENYDVTFTKGTLKIEKKAVNVGEKVNENFVDLEGVSNVIYNANFDYNLLKPKDELAGIVTYKYLDENQYQIESIKNAGSYYLRVDLVDAKNYRFTSTDDAFMLFNITVEKQKLSLEIVVTNKVYNGNAIEIKSVKANGEDIDKSLYKLTFKQGENVLANAPKNAGSYSVIVVETDAENYQFENNSANFEIEQKEITCNIEYTETFYNRNVQKPQIEMVGNVGADDISFDVVYTGGDLVQSGNYSVSVNAISGEDKDNYVFNATSFNYEIKAINAVVKVANPKVSYLGKQLTLGDIGLSVESENLEIVADDYSVSDLPTNVGEYSIQINSLNSNIILNVDSFNIEIVNAKITGIVLNDNTFTFDGNAKSLLVSGLTLSDGNVANVVYENNNQINAGSYVVTATITAPNYETLILNANLIIEVYNYEVEYAGNSVYTYNKTAQGDEVAPHSNENIANLISIRYVGVGNDYDSDEKPTNAGSYKLIVISNNVNNVEIVNSEREFIINKLTLNLANLNAQTTTFNGEVQQYSFNIVGVIQGDEIILDVTYNNSVDLPINAGSYSVKVVGVAGKDGENYRVAESNSTATLIIEKKVINVTANELTKVYGENDGVLSYVADELCKEDKFTGVLEREAGENQGTYAISIGSLTAGENYQIIFNSNSYIIKPRTLSVEAVQTNFVYNGKVINPQLIIGNIVATDNDVYTLEYVGDRKNAGTFTVNVVVNNRNYCLADDFNAVQITIEKKDATSAIIGLFEDESTYNGEEQEVIAMLNDVDDSSLQYEVAFKFKGESVSAIVNAGTYEVIVSINEANYKGTKTFTFNVNKAERVAEQIQCIAYSDRIVLTKIDGALYAINEYAYQISNEFTNLKANTAYVIRIKVQENENYKEYNYDPITVTTTFSASLFNEMLDNFGEKFTLDKLGELKAIYNAFANLSEEDKAVVNVDKYNDLINQFKDYIESVQNETNEAVKASSLAFGGLNLVKYIGAVLALVAFVSILRRSVRR